MSERPQRSAKRKAKRDRSSSVSPSPSVVHDVLPEQFSRVDISAEGPSFVRLPAVVPVSTSVSVMAGNNMHSFYVPYVLFRNTIFSARHIMFSVKVQRDQSIAQLQNLATSAVDYENSPVGPLVDVMSGTLADMLNRLIMALDFGERADGPNEVGSYNDAHVAFVKGCTQMLKILASPQSPVAAAHGIVIKP